jgi:hypothetical protein
VNWYECPHCRTRYQSDDCPSCDFCDRCESRLNFDGECENCERDVFEIVDDYRDDSVHINSYSYKPNPVFRGNGPVYLGMELEVAVRDYLINDAARAVSDRWGDLSYLKEDGSVDGFEIVNHPTDLRYYMQNVDWSLLPELYRIGANAHDSCGLHVHVSRSGFSSSLHTYRWLKFVYRNRLPWQSLSRRDTHWAKFEPAMRKAANKWSKGERGVASYPTGRMIRRQIWNDNGGRYEYQTIPEVEEVYPDRYSAVNVQNSATLEVRTFGSSLDPTEVKAALGLVDASVEYTRKLPAHDIVANGGWSWSSFAKWTKDHNTGLWSPLIDEMDKRCAS